METPIKQEQVLAWIDDDLVESSELIADEAAEFNVLVEMSNIYIHIIRRKPDGPLLIGQQIEYDDGIRSRIQELSEAARSDLISRIRETLTATPVVYGFHDRNGNNVHFAEVHRIFLEHRIYPGSIDQQTLMNGLIEVWKVMRYLDDIFTLIESVEQ
ncbi:DUF2299 family protein [Halosolutus halophilus]|uniref:DUF2299 family protein n=1 Tax=Halosolutus halophilus TaxID=1552990 RepID=UPI0022352BB7|nr:DUF2299 family protein [Halosolutus halophilus]